MSFEKMSIREREDFVKTNEVKRFLSEVRKAAHSERGVNGAEIQIPDTVLDVVREDVASHSKLYKHVSVKKVKGNSRVPIMGQVPEGIWMEMRGTLNELAFSINEMEVDGYKVGGFIPVCNAILEDSDISLATEIINALSQAIGYALDKAIIYGKGTKMPMGIVTRLAQTEAPENYPENARPWADLSKSNVITIPAESVDIQLFKDIVSAAEKASSKHSRKSKFWAMSEQTKNNLMIHALTFDTEGSIIAGVNDVMPVVGGIIEVLDFIPDGVMVFGYEDLYLLAERGKMVVAKSEHVKFMEDETVFKGTARYDGAPIIPEAFVVVGINGVNPIESIPDFANDFAN